MAVGAIQGARAAHPHNDQVDGGISSDFENAFRRRSEFHPEFLLQTGRRGDQFPQSLNKELFEIV